MADQQINILYFFSHPTEFPWDELGLSRPYVAATHTYMCRAASLYSDPNLKSLLNAGGTRSEIKRFSQAHGGVFKDIEAWCDQYPEPNCRFQKAKLVINWLRTQRGFTAYMQKRLDSLYRQGILSIPEGARPRGDL